ncbi:hypothetical protein [Thermococcus sp. Bubb.Bath]|uniref:hypothetical protein n=1 Tax=Thermococcus sp. Bubb.Bath TaxID=1638242 RepID=UPI00143C267E|nr:hypothetical protein [Thermococcus sp. Bubb.Bath]NJF26166.1 hypothetical protein [Thermococcus sp. Bubb.Bath]
MAENKIVIEGKHLRLEVKLIKSRAGEQYWPFPVLLLFDDHVLEGECWRGAGGKLQGTFEDPLIVIQELLAGLEEVFEPTPSEHGCGNPREYARKLGFNVMDNSPLYCATLSYANIFFERVGDTVRIHYHNRLLEATDCPEFKGKHKGTIEVPFFEFAEDVLKVVGEYLEEHALRVEEARRKYWNRDRSEDIEDYLKWYTADKTNLEALKQERSEAHGRG